MRFAEAQKGVNPISECIQRSAAPFTSEFGFNQRVSETEADYVVSEALQAALLRVRICNFFIFYGFPDLLQNLTYR